MNGLKNFLKLIGCCILFICLHVIPETCFCEETFEAKAANEPGESESPARSMIDNRLDEERKINDLAFILTPHRQNYLIPVLYNTSENTDVYQGTAAENIDLDHVEVKFQMSIKYMLINNLLKNNLDLYIAYSTLSYWQAYNKDVSSFFRDTNHEPESWLQWNADWDYHGVKAKFMRFGIWHQSNGRAEPISRSWNRLYANIILEKGCWAFSLKPWYRLPEDKEDDNNPDIEKFLGHGEIHVVYKKKENTFSLMFRNNTRISDNKGAVEVGWSFPLYHKLKGYVQYFNGYGQTILDYNHSSNTIGLGITLSDIL